MRLEKRNETSAVALVAAPFAAVAFTLLIAALLVLWAGAPVGKTYSQLLQGGFGSVFAWSETLTRATPLILTGLAATVAFKARLFNIGAEGQLYAGALAAIAVGGLHGGSGLEWSPWILFPLMLIAALGALLRIASVSSTAISTRLARLLRDLAAGCVLAVVMLMVFLPLARLRMPILTAIVMLGVAFVANTLARRATR